MSRTGGPVIAPSRPPAERRPIGARARQLDALLPNHAPLAAVLTMALILVGLAYGMNHNGYNIWGGFLVAPVLFLLSLPMANRAARRDGEAIGRIVLVAAAVKIFVTPILRYWMAFSVYGGTADANTYHDAGAILAPLFRHGDYGHLGQITGTRFMEILTGQVYALIGPTGLGGFVVFSWFGFLGCYLFYRAFRVAYPDGDGRRYALLVFFFPTMLFWTSSTGKEAFMALVLGAAALGTAQLIAGRFRGLVWLALGVWGAAVVRAHMALMVGVGLAVAAPIAVLTGGTRGDGRRRSRLGGAVLVLALLLAGSTLIGTAERFLGVQSLNAESAQEKLDLVQQQTSEGGSTYKTLSPNNPLGFVFDGITVLFRPLPIEAHNIQTVIAGLEGLAILVVCVGSRRRLARVPRELRRRPYAAFALVYTFAFIYAFSSINNFGILVRERSQLLPVLFVMLCIPHGDQKNPDDEPVVAEGSRTH